MDARTSSFSSSRPLAVVTGASSGIGFELAKQFAEHGFNLVIVADDPGIREAAQAFEAAGAQVHSLQTDLAKPSGVERLYAEISALGVPVDSLVINAGVGVGGDFARETDLEDEMNLINLNVTSVVHLTKRVVKDMVEAGHGRILFTSSIAAIMPGPFEAVYAASKAFVHSFAEALRNELKDTGVSVTSLMPGMTETNFFHRAGMDDTLAGHLAKDDPALVAKQGFEALMAGRDHVIAGGLMNRLQGMAVRFLPDEQKAAFHRLLSEPNRRKGSTKRSPKGF